MQFNFNDGGRAAAGYKGHTGDCVCRAICIATGLPYQQVYNKLAEGMNAQKLGKADSLKVKRAGKHGGAYLKQKIKAKTAAKGITVKRKWFKDYMQALGFRWVPTMGIGTGCKVHLTDGELPMGRLVVSVSKHYTAVIDGVINDTHDPQRATEWIHGDGTTTIERRCVYGYYILTPKS